jgi:predicted nucleotidyltransferase
MNELVRVKRPLRSWGEAKTFVRRLWIYGSRAKDLHRPESDLDVAIEFDPNDGEDCLTTWTFEGDAWQRELQGSLPWRLQLEWYDPDGSTPRIERGIRDGGILVYQRAT